jgi:protein-disulfide isomerase
MDHTKEVLASRTGRCTELVEKLCADIGADTQTCALLGGENGPKDPSGCEAMLDDYATVLEEVRAMEAKNQPLSAEQASKIAAAGAPGFGPEDAAVTIVEFSDFQCPYCSMAAAVVKRVEQEYAGKVRFVFRQFPLSFHPDAHLTGQASLAAHAQGKFWPFHDLVFANQEHLGRADLEGYAAQAGLDLEAFKKDLDAETYKASVDAELELGGQVFVSGTPSMFLNGKPVANPTDFDAIAKMIDAELGS